MTEQNGLGTQATTDVSAEDQAYLLDLDRRCKSAHVELTIEQATVEPRAYPIVHIQNGREKRSIALWRPENVVRFLSIHFEEYVFLSGYEAICSYGNGTIECVVRSLDRIPTSYLWRRLLEERGAEPEPSESESHIVIESDDHPGLTLALSQASDELQVLSRGSRPRPTLTFKVTGATITRHDEAVNLLSRLANAFFFQLELSCGVSLALERERTPPMRLARRPAEHNLKDLQFPKREYDEAPISLYWYGCSATGMPLLQFLAFYQVLEYYFPTYSQSDAKRRIANILKNPLFRADRDSDIGQLLGAIISRGGSIGDERSQLRSTVHECIDSEQLRTFITSDEKMVEFLQKKKSLAGHKVPVSNPEIDLRNDVADRIYDIRCKVVHTKGEVLTATAELLLPFSKEAAELCYDVELLRYLARQVLIAASSPLRVP